MLFLELFNFLNHYFSLLFFRIADGKVATIDMRTMPTQVDQEFQCFEGSILTLSPHPLDENLFMASCVNGYGGKQEYLSYYLFNLLFKTGKLACSICVTCNQVQPLLHALTLFIACLMLSVKSVALSILH